MDRVKFGRALGYGARHAARTLAQAADAAAAPSPRANPASARRQDQPAAAAAPRASRMVDARTISAAGRQAKSSLVTPVVRFSSVIWLQVTGVFFALVAFTMGAAAWRTGVSLHGAASSHLEMKLWAYIAVCTLFTYFTVSSFVRAARK